MADNVVALPQFPHGREPPDTVDNPYRVRYAQLVLTLAYGCNMRCPHCFIGEKLDDHETRLSYDDAVQIIESAARLQTIRSVAFVGGEPFLFYKLMLRIAAYVHRHYHCDLNVTTNASWAKTANQTEKLLDPLHALGLRWLMVSLDSYHLEYGTFECVAYCLARAQELGINAAAQVIARRGAPGVVEYKSMLREQIDVERVRWIESPCSALGNAQTMLEDDDLEWHEDVPEGGCNAGEILNIQPDGGIKPCCGAGLMAPRLSLGNARRESLAGAVWRAEADPIINSLIAEQGPRGLARSLREAGRGDLVERHAPFTDACHACHSFLTDPETLEVLESLVRGREVELLANRVLGLHGTRILGGLHETADSV